MPDLTGFPALDVLIGLALMLFVLATVCSAINEAIAALLAWRAKNLEKAIRNLLGGAEPGIIGRLKKTKSGRQVLEEVKKAERKAEESARKAGDAAGVVASKVQAAAEEKLEEVGDLTARLFRHWRIRSLARRPNADFHDRTPITGWRGPSYIPAPAFARALDDLLFPESAAGDPFETARGKVARIGNPWVENALVGILTDAKGDRDAFRKNVETWFDDTMERASGWYKRKVQIMLFVIATVVAIAVNANALHVAHSLWTDDALRAAVVQKADAIAQSASGQGSGQAGTSGGSATSGKPSSDECEKERKARPPKPPSLGCALEGVATAVDDVQALGLPLGWSEANRPPDSYGGWGGTIGGLLVTIFALSLGAPFWFDVLSKASSLRNTGKPVATKADLDPAADVPPARQEVVVRVTGAGDAPAERAAGTEAE